MLPMTGAIIRYRLPRRPKSRFTRNTGIIFRYSAKSCCECEAGRIISSSKDMAGEAEEDRADIECPLEQPNAMITVREACGLERTE